MHLRSAVNFVNFVMLQAASTWTAVVSFVKFVSCTSRVRRLNSYGSAFFPLFFVSFRHSERWLAMLIKELDLHGIELSPYVRLSASSSSRFRFRTQNSRYSHSVTSLLQAQFDSDQKMHSWSWTKRFWLSAANMSCHSGLSHLGRKE